MRSLRRALVLAPVALAFGLSSCQPEEDPQGPGASLALESVAEPGSGPEAVVPVPVGQTHRARRLRQHGLAEDPGDETSQGTPDAGEIPPRASCEDGLLSQDESDVDCGGPCDPCGEGWGCRKPTDCASGACKSERCVAPSAGCAVPTLEAGRHLRVVCDGQPIEFVGAFTVSSSDPGWLTYSLFDGPTEDGYYLLQLKVRAALDPSSCPAEIALPLGSDPLVGLRIVNWRQRMGGAPLSLWPVGEASAVWRDGGLPGAGGKLTLDAFWGKGVSYSCEGCVLMDTGICPSWGPLHCTIDGSFHESLP